MRLSSEDSRERNAQATARMLRKNLLMPGKLKGKSTIGILQRLCLSRQCPARMTGADNKARRGICVAQADVGTEPCALSAPTSRWRGPAGNAASSARYPAKAADNLFWQGQEFAAASDGSAAGSSGWLRPWASPIRP